MSMEIADYSKIKIEIRGKLFNHNLHPNRCCLFFFILYNLHWYSATDEYSSTTHNNFNHVAAYSANINFSNIRHPFTSNWFLRIMIFVRMCRLFALNSFATVIAEDRVVWVFLSATRTSHLLFVNGLLHVFTCSFKRRVNFLRGYWESFL